MGELTVVMLKGSVQNVARQNVPLFFSLVLYCKPASFSAEYFFEILIYIYFFIDVFRFVVRIK